MVKPKEQMPEYVTNHLEESGLYRILSRDSRHVLVKELPDTAENPHTIDVLVHTTHRTVREVARAVANNTRQQIYTAHAFLKDGETFMVRLAERGAIKDPRSLKGYTKQQIDSMIHLRDLEKAVLGWTRHPRLTFYQPRTARLHEGIRAYTLNPVHLDYSHLQPGDNGFGFAKNGFADDFKMPVEVESGNGPLELQLGNGTYTAGIAVMERPVEAIQGRLL